MESGGPSKKCVSGILKAASEASGYINNIQICEVCSNGSSIDLDICLSCRYRNKWSLDMQAYIEIMESFGFNVIQEIPSKDS